MAVSEVIKNRREELSALGNLLAQQEMKPQ